jgi:flagellar basal-body rod protein FlgG
MISGLYQSAMGLMNQMENHRVLSENLASVSTPGYRRTLASFESYLNPNSPASSGSGDANPAVGTQLFPSQVVSVQSTTDFTPGEFRRDGNPQHAAISGPAFFAVEAPDGSRAYTRDGTFHLDPQGQIVTSTGWKVLGDDGQALTLPKAYQSFLISETGDIIQQGTLPGQSGTSIGKLQLTTFKNPSKDLRWVGGNYFATVDANVQPDQEAPPSQLLQGHVENSNVNTTQEMVNMITAMRAYEANQKMLQVQDGTLDTVIRQVASRL